MQQAFRSVASVNQTDEASAFSVESIARDHHYVGLESTDPVRISGQAGANADGGSENAGSEGSASADVAAMRAALRLQTIVRYLGQHHWDEETSHARAADRIESGLKLENVAAHSWQVADAALLLVPHFPELSIGRTVEIAILHDKLEMITGDFDPVGSDGRGTDSHAFDSDAQRRKRAVELSALESYLRGIREPSRSLQRSLLLEAIDGTSAEARFVKAIDKLQALVFVIEKKRGSMSDEHLDFSIRYAGKSIDYFPGLACHCHILLQDLLRSVAVHRAMDVSEVEARLTVSATDLLRRAHP